MPQTIKMAGESRSPSLKWWDRIDPLTEILWKDTVRSSWESISVVRHSLEMHPDGSLRQVSENTYSPISVSQYELYNMRAIRVVAMLHEYQQLTTMQLATLLGESRQAVWQSLSALYDAGILMRLIPKWWRDDMTPEDSGSGSVWRLHRRSWKMKHWLNGLDGQEYGLVTNGTDILTHSVGEVTPTALRHNLMSAEIMIRAMEAVPGVIGAWGESHLQADNLMPHFQHTRDEVRKNVGDGAIITGSGRIIVIETSGSGMQKSGMTNANKIVEKAAAWTGICGKSDLDICVVFVEASVDPQLEAFMQNVKYGVEEVSRRFVSNKAYRDEGMSRVFAVDGRSWFPIARGVSSDFTSMNVRDARTGKFVSLVRPQDLNPDPTNDGVVNTLASLHTPWWVHNKLEDINE